MSPPLTAAPPESDRILAVARNAAAARDADTLHRILVQDTQLLAESDHCALVTHDGEFARVAAVGHRKSVDDEPALIRALERIAPRCGRHAGILVASTHGPASGLDADAAESVTVALRGCGAHTLVAVPLTHGDGQVGSLLLVYRTLQPPSAESLKPIARAAPLLALALRKVGDKRQPDATDSAQGDTTEVTSTPLVPVARRRRRLAAILATCVAIVLALPIPFRVGGIAELAAEREHRCYVELAGTIAEVAVTEGQQVQQGDLIARLDDRDLQFELRTSARQLERLAAEVEILRSRAAVDAEQGPELQRARLEHARVAAEHEHLASLRARLTLRAPTTGVVTTERVERSIGRRFEAGEVFCEIAPTEELDLVVHLPERDYAFAAPGTEMTVVFASAPSRPVRTTIASVAPIATRDPEHGNSFEVRAPFDGADATLRPGMAGTGYLSVGWRPLGYVLLRRAAHRVRMALLFL